MRLIPDTDAGGWAWRVAVVVPALVRPAAAPGRRAWAERPAPAPRTRPVAGPRGGPSRWRPRPPRPLWPARSQHHQLARLPRQCEDPRRAGWLPGHAGHHRAMRAPIRVNPDHHRRHQHVQNVVGEGIGVLLRSHVRGGRAGRRGPATAPGWALTGKGTSGLEERHAAGVIIASASGRADHLSPGPRLLGPRRLPLTLVDR